MHTPAGDEARDRSTRAGFVRATMAAGAAAAAAIALGESRGDGTSRAATNDSDAKILAAFLELERVQEAFYREALATGRLSRELRAYATAVGRQEREHVRQVSARLGSRAKRSQPPRFGGVFDTSDRFQRAAIDLEEATIALYIGQAPNLTEHVMRFAGTLVSVEARQAAWIRDLAGVLPAPRAADPPSRSADVLAELREKGVLR